MSDSNWSPVDASGADRGAVPPTGADAGPPPGWAPPGYGYGPLPPGSGPQPGSQPPPYGAPPGWTPPPKPGLIPLRPLGFGTLLGAPFMVLRRNPAPTVGTGLLVNFVAQLVTVAVVVPLTIWTVMRTESAAPEDQNAVLAGSLGIGLLAMLVPLAVGVLGSAILQGVIVNDVAAGTLGERLRFGTLWRRTAKRMWPLIAWTSITVLAMLLLMGVFIAVIAVASMLSPVAVAIAVGVCLLLGVGAAVLFAWLGVKLSIVPSVIVLERVGVIRAVRRSWALTNGAFWRTLGIIVLMNVILSVAANVVTLPFSFVLPMIGAILDPTGAGVAVVLSIVMLVLTLVIGIVIGSVSGVVSAALLGLVYIDRRMRTEGLDLDLQRAAEARAAGRPAPDPFATEGAEAR